MTRSLDNLLSINNINNASEPHVMTVLQMVDYQLVICAVIYLTDVQRFA